MLSRRQQIFESSDFGKPRRRTRQSWTGYPGASLYMHITQSAFVSLVIIKIKFSEMDSKQPTAVYSDKTQIRSVVKESLPEMAISAENTCSSDVVFACSDLLLGLRFGRPQQQWLKESANWTDTKLLPLPFSPPQTPTSLTVAVAHVTTESSCLGFADKNIGAHGGESRIKRLVSVRIRSF